MKIVTAIIVSSAILVSCSSDTEVNKQTPSTAIEQEEFQKPIVHPTKSLTVDISGMSCEMGCGGAIRKELYATNAVDEVSFDFKMGREQNTATITFDGEKISDEKITSLIEALNEQQFTIENPVTETIENESSSDEASSGSETRVVKSSSFKEENIVSNFSQSIIELIVSSIIRR